MLVVQKSNEIRLSGVKNFNDEELTFLTTLFLQATVAHSLHRHCCFDNTEEWGREQ